MFGLIANAVAGGLAGGGQAAERGFARLGETQARMDLEQLRGQIESDRQAALARLQSQLRREDARFSKDLDLEVAERERGAVRGIIEGATAQARDEQRPDSEIRRAARGALANAGRLREAADYDRATEGDRPTVVNTPFGYKSTVLDRDGNVLREVDNASDLRAQNDRMRAERTGAGRAPRPIDQAAIDRIHDSAVKFADRLAGEMPHPLADPGATGKDAGKDLALMGIARSLYSKGLTNAARRGDVQEPGQIEDAIREVAPKAHERAMARAEAYASSLFDDKGRPRTGADAAMKDLGVRALDRDGFVRAVRDKLLPTEFDAIVEENSSRRRQRAGGEGTAIANRSGARADAGGMDGTPPGTGGERPDDPARLARRPTGLIGGAAGNPMTHDGLPARRNADGSYSTELSITVTDPRLNGGRPTNIPSLWGGREVDEDTAVKKALDSGKQYPAFANVQEAVEAARARSEAGGAGPLVGGAGSEAPAEPDPGPGGLGSALDTARQERAAARAELQRFGLRQQKQDPEGFRAARERAAAADEALRRAQAAYERAMTGGRNEVGFSALQRGG